MASQAVRTKKIVPTDGPPARVLPIASLVVNAIFMFQAIVLDWRLGTLIWIYWLQGFLIILLGLWANRKNPGWFVLLALMSFYAIFLLALTFPSDSVSYFKNGVQVRPEEFTVFADTQWNIVFFNILALFVGYFIARFIRQDKTAYSGAYVAKRITPLHLTIVFASFTSWSVILFLVLRSVFDVSVELSSGWLKQKGYTMHTKTPATK